MEITNPPSRQQTAPGAIPLSLQQLEVLLNRQPVLPSLDGVHFSPREKSVILCLGHGMSNKEIACSLTQANGQPITYDTAKLYVAKLIQKTGRNRWQLMLLGRDMVKSATVQ